MSISPLPNPLVQKLTDFGFSETEAKVYVTLLEYGRELGGTKLALLTKLHRQYVYLALPKLLAQGLIEEIAHGKQSKYKARSPQVIETLGRKKAIEAGDLARELNLISNIGNEQEFEVIQGVRAIQQYELQLVDRSDEHASELILGGASDAFGELMGDTLSEYLDLKAEKQIGVKYLGTDDERDFYRKYIGTFPNQEYRFMSKLPKGRTHMVIRPDTVSFYTFLNPPLVYVVKSPVIAENYKDFFMMLWEMGSA